MLAAAAHKSVLDKLRLGDLAEVLNFRLATDPIEQVAHFSRAIA